MKTTKNKFLCIAVALLSLASCSEDYLEVEPKGSFLSDNYYKNEEQATAALIATYDIIRKNSGGFENLVTILNASSDDFFAGGGNATDGAGIQNASKHQSNSSDMPQSYWSDHYQGINRANTLLQRLPKTSMPDALKTRYVAECKALRAIYYFNLVRMFKNVPLILEPLTGSNIFNVSQVAPESIYGQIEKDLLEAIVALPVSVDAGTQSGRLTKGGAQAMLGKVYLFENKKTEAAIILEQVNGSPGQANQYGNKLLSNYNDLWVATNKFNTESLIEVNHSALGNSGWGDGSLWAGDDEGNMVCQMVGPRTYVKKNSTAPDIITNGWSFNTVTDELYDIIKLDPRFNATILDLKSLEASGAATYLKANQNTGYFLNKFIPKTSEIAASGQQELNYRQNTYLIRLADTYLMEAEALGSGARAQALLDAVRARVGLPSVPVTILAIKNERRMELAGEGQRFFDLVRWGDATTKLANRGFDAGVDEIFPIPFRELQGTKLVQNPGYN
jgi:starch-binding outer membrane protein, SusD/RagB family